MEKIRVIATGLRVCQWYLVAFHVLFVLQCLFAILAFFSHESGMNYCIYAADGESYDFVLSGGTHCRIDWSFFYGELFFPLAALYVIFSGPVWLARFLLERLKIQSPG